MSRETEELKKSLLHNKLRLRTGTSGVLPQLQPAQFVMSMATVRLKYQYTHTLERKHSYGFYSFATLKKGMES
jgi:hypothetical protein